MGPVVCFEKIHVHVYKVSYCDKGEMRDKSQKVLYFTTPFILSKMLEITGLAKKLVFLQFSFFEFNDDVIVNLGEVSLKLLHDVLENIQLRLDIFHETTVADISSYFPYCNDAIGFLKLFNTWWKISNSKDQYCFGNYIGRAAIQNDNKPGFLIEMAAWLKRWDN